MPMKAYPASNGMKRGNVTKFGRVRKVRVAMFKALMTALIEHGKIKTTEAKAKSLSVYADRMVTLAKKHDIASRKIAVQSLGTKAVKDLFDRVAPLFEDVKGGYTRIIKLSPRRSDRSPMSIIEFTKMVHIAPEKEDKKAK